MKDKRPLSPHISIHKWIFSQIMSILHRATAIGFSIGLLFVALWLCAITFGQNYYFIFKFVFFNFFGKMIILIICFCFCFHFIDEVRKFFWNFGIGLDIKTLRITSYIVIFFSLVFETLIFLFLL